MEANIKELSQYRLEKAKRNLEVVESLIEDGYYDFAVNRAYYAAFDAMRAVNALDGFDSGKHSGVIAHFNQFHVKNGDFKPETSAVIRRASNLREKSDYEDFYQAEKEDAAETFEMIQDFVADVEQFLVGQEESLDKKSSSKQDAETSANPEHRD